MGRKRANGATDYWVCFGQGIVSVRNSTEGRQTESHHTRALSRRSAESTTQAAMFSKRWERRWKQWLVVLSLLLSDVLLALLVSLTASTLQGFWGQGPLSSASVGSIGITMMVWILMRVLLGLYPGYGLNQVEELRRQTYTALAALAVTATLAFGLQVGDLLSRLLVGLSSLELLLLSPLVRHLVKWGLGKVGLWGKPVAILGAAEAGKQLAQTLWREGGMGLRPVTVFDFEVSEGEVLEGAAHGETVAGAMDLARHQGIGTAVFAMPQVRSEQLSRFVGRASLIFPYIIVIPNLNGTTTSAVIARDLGGTLGLEIKHNLLNPWAQRLKRAMDIGCVVVGGALISPLLLVLSLFVWLERRGPILYWDLRMGKDANTFWCVKFRTMVDEADAELQRLLEENSRLREEYLEYHKLRDDPRITPVGKWLRTTSLDELPQLWNVLRGEMSLVGPRPYKPRESEVVGLAQEEILRVRPGITGLWQVSGRNSVSFKQRIQMDGYYVRNWSVWLDFVVLIRTAETVVFREGAA